MRDNDFYDFNRAADVIEIEGQLEHTDKANPEFEQIYAENVQKMKSLLAKYDINEQQLDNSNLASLGTSENVNIALDRLKHETEKYIDPGEVISFDKSIFLGKLVEEYLNRVARDN